jgi:molybdate transport system regulatory protein
MATQIPRFRVKKPPHLSRHPQPGYSVRGRIWLEKNGELYMGWGRAMLLERIEELGSIAAAARSMKLGYRNAWLWIESANRLAPSPLIEKTTGGAGGGHARLTEEGRKAIARYKNLRARFAEFLKEVEE